LRGKTVLETESLPGKSMLLRKRFWVLLKARGNRAQNDPLLQLRGSGRKLWKADPAHGYVNRLRER
jgi:hypothetical protein